MPRKPPKHARSSTTTTPGPTWTTRIARIALAQLAFNAMAILLLGLSAVVLEILGMRFGLYLLIPLVGAQFLIFPGLSLWLAHRLGFTDGRDGAGDFWYFMVLSFGLLVWVFPSVPLSLDAWRLTRSTEASAHSLAEVLVHGHAPMVLELPGFQPVFEPRGSYTRRTRSEDGRVSTTHYTAVPLVAPAGEMDPRLWLGWKDSLRDAQTAPFFRVNPWNDTEYRLAVEDALGREPTGQYMILERTPDLATARTQAWDSLRLGFWLANGLSLGGFVLINIGIVIHRLRKK